MLWIAPTGGSSSTSPRARSWTPPPCRRCSPRTAARSGAAGAWCWSTRATRSRGRSRSPAWTGSSTSSTPSTRPGRSSTRTSGPVRKSHAESAGVSSPVAASSTLEIPEGFLRVCVLATDDDPRASSTRDLRPDPLASIADRLPRPSLCGAQDRVAHLGRAGAVLERGAVGRDVGVVADRGQQVVDLVHERVLPADDVAGRPPVRPERMVGLGDQHRAKALRRRARRRSLEVDLELVEALEVEGDRALAAVELPAQGVLAPGGEARGLDRPHGAALEGDRGLDRVVDLAAGLERRGERGHRFDLAHEVAGEVDDVRGQVAEGAGAGGGLVEAPHLVGGRAPVLQIRRAEVADLADVAGLDDLARQPHRGDEAVVEGAHVLDPRGPHALPGLVALGGVATQRLLADDVLAGLGGGDRRLGVQVVGAGVVEQRDAGIADDRPPVGYV